MPSDRSKARKRLAVLERRARFLGDRASKSSANLSFDVAERAALLWALSVLKPMYEEAAPAPGQAAESPNG